MIRDTPVPDARYDRRTVLKAGVAAASTAAIGVVPSSASASEGSADADLSEWLSNVSNVDGVVDETGKSEVTIEVGANGNNGAFAFGPAVVRVDPGTTVVWEWNGKGGSHNVVANDSAYESKLYGNDGDTFEYAFESEGVSSYYCAPHKPMGMKGAVVVGDLDVKLPSGSGDESGDESGDGESGGESAGEDVDYGGWFDDVSNFGGTVDRTGESEVTVEVGADGNNGAFGFGPAAIRVDPGTTVVWEWTGKGGSHNVVANDGAYESKMLGDAGATFEITFDEPGISKYYCLPHKAMGMKGAVIVGDPASAAGSDAGVGEDATGGGDGDDLWLIGLAGGLATALLSPLLFGAFLWANDDTESNRGKYHGPGRRH